MFEVLGYFLFFSVILFFVFLQYSLMASGLYRKDLNKLESFIGCVPLLPFILMFILTIYYILEILFKKFKVWICQNV